MSYRYGECALSSFRYMIQPISRLKQFGYIVLFLEDSLHLDLVVELVLENLDTQIPKLSSSLSLLSLGSLGADL